MKDKKELAARLAQMIERSRQTVYIREDHSTAIGTRFFSVYVIDEQRENSIVDISREVGELIGGKIETKSRWLVRVTGNKGYEPTRSPGTIAIRLGAAIFALIGNESPCLIDYRELP